MTEKDIHEETDSEKRHFSPQKGNDQTGEPAFEGGIENSGLLHEGTKEELAEELENQDGLVEEKQEETTSEPSEFFLKWQERHEAFLAQKSEIERTTADSKKEKEKEKVKETKSKKKHSFFKKAKQPTMDPLSIDETSFSEEKQERATQKEKIPQELIWKTVPIISIALSFAMICLYFISPLGNLKQIIVEGNEHVSSSKIVQDSLIRKEDYILSTILNKSGHENNIKHSSPWVKDVTVSFAFPNTFTISIQEYNQIGFVKQGDKYYSVLSSGDVSETETSQEQLPPIYTTIHLTDLELIKKLVLQLTAVNQSILSDIQDIQLTPSKVTNDLLTLTMFSGHKVLVPLSDIDYKLPYYEKIASKLQVASIIDMEVGIFSYASP